MANNRMFLVNKRGNVRLMIAKYYPSTGWYPTEGMCERLGSMMDHLDFGHLTDEQRAENAAHPGLGVPHPSIAGMFGEPGEWSLDFEVPPGEDAW